MTAYCTLCGKWDDLDVLSYLCGGCADTWVRVREAQEAA